MYYFLNEKLYFPPVEKSDEDGILAIGGDLSPERLLLAYRSGIFPWFNEDDPIIWWSPNPRFIMYPHAIKISKSMKQILKSKKFDITFDTVFRDVITNCQMIRRKRQAGTWITEEMLEAYTHLHELGFAHSVETWQNGELVGGLYGISLGKVFFGESMFAKVSNASKIAYISLVSNLQALDFELIDCQVYTEHLESLGAVNVPREEFMRLLAKGLAGKTLQGNWAYFNKR